MKEKSLDILFFTSEETPSVVKRSKKVIVTHHHKLNLRCTLLREKFLHTVSQQAFFEKSSVTLTSVENFISSNLTLPFARKVRIPGKHLCLCQSVNGDKTLKVLHEFTVKENAIYIIIEFNSTYYRWDSTFGKKAHIVLKHDKEVRQKFLEFLRAL